MSHWMLLFILVPNFQIRLFYDRYKVGIEEFCILRLTYYKIKKLLYDFLL